MSETRNFTNSPVTLVLALLLAVAVYRAPEIIEAIRKPAPSPVVPVPVVETWQAELTAALKAEDNPKRVEQLRNLWAGFATVVPKEANSIIAVQRMNKLAGSVAVADLGPRNPAASEIVQKQFDKVIKSTRDPLDDSEREQVRQLFEKLAAAAGDAL